MENLPGKKEAMKQAWVEWSEKLNTVEGRNKIFRVASQMKEDKTDILGTNLIKNEESGIEVEEEAVRNDLLNEEN